MKMKGRTLKDNQDFQIMGFGFDASYQFPRYRKDQHVEFLGALISIRPLLRFS